jgi:hypothetical protein
MRKSLLVRAITAGAVLAGLAAPLTAWAGPIQIFPGVLHIPPGIVLDPAVLAKSSIDAKASQLGHDFTGDAVSGLEQVNGGYRIRYQNCDIYDSPGTGAHEVHGDIRNKYNAKGGPSSDLGLPITDETGTPDGVGRYNHFSTNGSIYWQPNTGPMEVHGGIRGAWAGQGWEQGPLGYPTTDERVVGPSQWVSEFQNGLLYWEADGGHPALEAGLSKDRLAQAVRRIFEANKGDGDLYVDDVSVTDVSDTGYDFWESRNRLVTIHFDGHYHIPWPLPDSHWNMDLRLLFAGDRHDDGSMHLWVALDHWYIHTSGIGHGSLLDGLKNGVTKLFASPLALGDIPADAKPLSFKVMPDGGITLYLQPHVEGGLDLGNLARYLVQQKLDQFVDG